MGGFTLRSNTKETPQSSDLTDQEHKFGPKDFTLGYRSKILLFINKGLKRRMTLECIFKPFGQALLDKRDKFHVCKSDKSNTGFMAFRDICKLAKKDVMQLRVGLMAQKTHPKHLLHVF